MKRFFSAIIILLTSVSLSWAQMTDDQVVDYIKTHTSSGEDQRSIAMDLLKQGATQDQLMRIKRKYESGSASSNSNSVAADDIVRSRESNGELLPDVDVSSLSVKSKIFGHDIFRSKNLSFEPQMNVATPAKYVLGPGDEVIVDIYGASQMNGSYKVAPDGSITIPNEGPVNVSGLTVTQAQSKVRKSIGGHYQGSTIKLSVGQTRTIMVNVMGEVTTPGTYTLSAFATVFNALYLAGGITEIGTMRNIKVSRNGRIISTVDVYDFILNGKLAGNVMLQDNDVIMVGPYDNLVEITGKIKRPMFYEMKKNESLQSLLTFAGGFTGDAYKEKIRVERKSSEGLTVHNIDEFDFTTFHNEDGDVVIVQPIIERYKNTVTARGALFRPGNYKLDAKVNTVKSLIEQAGGLLEQAVTSRAVLKRMMADRTFETRSLDLDAILRGTSPDVALQNEDVLIVASSEELNDAKTFSIYGEVFHPGKYNYAANTTVEDLITQAGGLREAASLKSVEVARRITDADGTVDEKQVAKIFNFDINQNLSLNGGTGFILQPYDIVTIHRNPDYQVQKTVYVAGEVMYAGAYVLSSKEERLSDIVKRAGGLTKYGNAKGAQLQRRISLKDRELQMKKLEAAQTEADSLQIMSDIEKTSYSVGINLSMVLDDPYSSKDIVLQEGDSIYVPKLNNTVKISGEVLLPNTVAFCKGKSATYYINQAGGIAENGKKSKAYVVYASGQASPLSKAKIEPGCEIVVPSKIEKKIDTAKVSMWATLASTVATVGAVVSNIVK